MSASSDFYLARADDCMCEAREAKLTNVRERCLRAEAAWRKMAERILYTEASKVQQDAEKARNRAAVE